MPVADETTLSELFELLSHPRRRFVLGVLDETDGCVLTDALAERIAVWEDADGLVESGASGVDDIRVSLFHTHLPKLENAGLVTYDSTHTRLAVGEAALADLSIDEQLQEERDRMFEHCC